MDVFVDQSLFSEAAWMRDTEHGDTRGEKRAMVSKGYVVENLTLSSEQRPGSEWA